MEWDGIHTGLQAMEGDELALGLVVLRYHGGDTATGFADRNIVNWCFGLQWRYLPCLHAAEGGWLHIHIPIHLSAMMAERSRLGCPTSPTEGAITTPRIQSHASFLPLTLSQSITITIARMAGRRKILDLPQSRATVDVSPIDM